MDAILVVEKCAPRASTLAMGISALKCCGGNSHSWQDNRIINLCINIGDATSQNYGKATEAQTSKRFSIFFGIVNNKDQNKRKI